MNDDGLIDDGDATGNDLSRRDALRKAGVAAGIAWTAPVVTSFFSRAAAGTPPQATTTTTGPEPHPECIGATCTTFRPCSSGNPDCVCVTSSGGSGFCIPGSTLCASLTSCDAELNCPPESFCAVDTCCGNPVCIPFDLAQSCPTDTNGVNATAQRTPTGAGTVGG